MLLFSPTLCDPMNHSTLGFPVHHLEFLEHAQTHVHWVSDVIQTSHPLSPLSPLDLSLSQHQGFFQRVRFSHKVAKVFKLQLQLQHQSFQWIFRFISFRIDWFGLAVQGNFKSLLQHHSLKASILWCSAFFMVQFSHLYMTTGKTIALTIQTLVKWCLCFWIYCLGLSQIFFQGAAIFKFHGFSHHLQWFWRWRKKKSVTLSTLFLSICHEVMDQMPWSLVFACSVLSQLFHSLRLSSSRGSLVLCFLTLKWYLLHMWGCWYFSQLFIN